MMSVTTVRKELFNPLAVASIFRTNISSTDVINHILLKKRPILTAVLFFVLMPVDTLV